MSVSFSSFSYAQLTLTWCAVKKCLLSTLRRPTLSMDKRAKATIIEEEDPIGDRLHGPNIGYRVFDFLAFLSIAGSCLGRFIFEAELDFAFLG